MDFSLHAQDAYSDAFTVAAGVMDNSFSWVIFSIRYVQSLFFVCCLSSQQSIPARRAEQRPAVLQGQKVTLEIQSQFEIQPLTHHSFLL